MTALGDENKRSDDVMNKGSRGDLTSGSTAAVLIRFALPYLLSCFLQTFYGMADLFVVGIYNDKSVSAAVSIGGQVTHMLTVILVGLAMGLTVHIGNAAGAKNTARQKTLFGTSISFFAAVSLLLTAAALVFTRRISSIMQTPAESAEDTIRYLSVCFCGVPFIAAFNVVSAFFRGVGDSKRPMYFVGAACAVNIALDFVFVGGFGLGACGAALATVVGQAASAVMAIWSYTRADLGFKIDRSDLKPNKAALRIILNVGIPVALQDGLIQVAFTIIIVIANSRGLVFSAAVGIVEKLIGFMFLVPSAFLSAISAVTAQNIGADKPQRARSSLYCGLAVTMLWGLLCGVLCSLFPEAAVSLFTKDARVISAGCDYLRTYSWDCFFAAIHFCFSGYFCGCGRSIISFIHNIVSIVTVRIPGAFLASRLFPDTLLPMGAAAPLGSILSALICIAVYMYYRKHEKA